MSKEQSQEIVDIKVKVDTTEVERLGDVAKSSSKDISKQTSKAFNQLGPSARKSIDQINKQMKKLSSGISNQVTQGSQSGFQQMVEIAKRYVNKVKNMMGDMMAKVKTTPTPSTPIPQKQNESRSTSGRTGALTSRYLAGMLSAVAAFGTLRNAINNANDATETASLFMTVWGERTSEVNSWISELSDTLGINQVEMQNTTATLFNMAKNLGLTANQSQKLAQDLGMLSQDMASFYNMNSSDVFNDIKSVLSGSGEVFSKYGAIINETTIKEYAYANGIASVGAELSIADKTMARYMLMMDKTSSAHGDLARTINSPANQARIFANNLNKLSIALGTCFQPILVVVLPILNKLTLALTSVLNAVSSFVTSLMSLLGFDMSGLLGGTGGILDTSGAIEEVSDSVGGIGESASNAAKEAEKLAKGLLGIDTVSNISSTSSSSDSSSSSGSGSVSTPTIDISSALADQESKIEGWVKRVADAILSVTATFKEGFNKNIKYVNQALGNLKTSFSNLGDAIQSFLVGAWNNGLKDLVSGIGSLSSAIVGAFLDISAQIVQVIANLFNYLNPETNQYTKKFLESLSTLVQACENFVKSIGGWFATFVNNGGQAFINVMGDIVMIIGTTLANVLANCIQWVTDFFNSWLGQVVLKTVATTLNILAGTLKAVLVVVEKLSPVISAFLLAWAGYKVIQTTDKLIKGFGDSLLGLAVKIENVIVDGVGLAKTLGTNLSKGVSTALTSMSKLKTSLIGVASNTKGAIIGFINWAKGLTLSTIATNAATLATTLLNTALLILTSPITFIVAGIVALTAVVITIGKQFGWWTNITEWLSEKLGWLWDGVKKFFGWKDDNNVSSAFDETSESIEGMGDSFEEATSEIETTSERFGTVASKINQHFASIGFDAGKLASDLSEAEAMFNEKFGLMSKNAKDYLDALVTGNEEVLQQMSTDSGSYTEEILYSYQKLSDNEKNIFYQTYGYIQGINDDWLSYSNLTYDQLMAKHVAYSGNILSQENLTAQEKDRLIDEHLTKVEEVYQQELDALKEQREKILSNTELSENTRQQMLEDINNMIIQKEQEKTQDTIQGIEDVKGAQEEASKAQTKAYEDSTKAQSEALVDVDKQLETTKKGLVSFKKESDKIANSIPTAWNGIGNKISVEFTKAKKQVTTEMQLLAKSVLNQFNQMKTSISGIFNQVTITMQAQFNTMNQNVKSQLSVMETTISTSSTNFKNTFSRNLDDMGNKVWSKFNSMLSDIRYFVEQMKKTMNFTFPVPHLKIPHLSVSGNWDFEKKTVPKFNVNWYSSGGIFSSRTLIGVGDANNGVGNNAEAVLPLDVLWKQLQNNFDKQNQQLAKVMAYGDQGGTIILKLDGTEMAKAQFRSFRELAQLGIIDFSEFI